jgi:hypothetical protein
MKREQEVRAKARQQELDRRRREKRQLQEVYRLAQENRGERPPYRRRDTRVN